MTTIEFSDYMDVALKPKGVVLDDYEKSLLLTLSQEQLVEDLYSNESVSFEETEKRRRYLSNLVYSFKAYRNKADRPKFTKPYADETLVEYDTATAVNNDRIENYSLIEGNGNQSGVRENADIDVNEEDIRSGVPILEDIPLTKKTKGFQKIQSDSSIVTLPENILYIVYEQVTFSDLNLECLDGNTAVVTPITHDEYYRAMQNPFRRPNERRVFRLDVAHPNNEFEAEGRLLYLYDRYHNIRQEDIEVSKGYNEVNGYTDRFNLRDDDRPQMIELISKYKIDTYFCRYLKRPNPIVVNELPEYLTVYGFNHRTESEVNPALHKIIAENAIKMALARR